MVCVQTAKIAPPLHAPALQRGLPAQHKSLAAATALNMMRSHMASSDPSNSANKAHSDQPKKGLDSQLWHACAGGMVQLPPVGAKVIYFPQGHGEQAAAIPDFPRSGGTILCRVISVDFLADAETDEVYAKMKLQPEVAPAPLFGTRMGDDEELVSSPTVVEKPASFAKTLTQSDANNGGGFSVPRYCAETIFPRLDYSIDPPVQTVLAKDVHGEIWKFRHIYRGTPRRHLLTTGWSTFVNQKKLVAGDAIVFLRSASGELCVGVRRSMRGPGNGDSGISWHSSPGQRSLPQNSSRWEIKSESGYSELLSGNGSGTSGASFARNRARVTSKSVLEAASLAAAGQAFEVVYYPRASTAEFCVRASVVKASLEHSWYPGMRFKMAFETEDSSRISWFMGTISAVQPADPIRWPSSPWRILQVSWDEPDLLQGVNRVSPWQVELVSTLPMQLPPFSLPRKKIRPLDLQFGESQGGFMGLPMAALANNVLGQMNPWQSLSEEVPAGMQGARQERFYGLTLSEFQPKQRVAGLFLDGAYPLDHSMTSRGATTDLRLNNFATTTTTPHDYFQLQQANIINATNTGRSAYGTPAAATQSESTAPPSVAPKSGTKRTATFLLFGKSIDPNYNPEEQQLQQQQNSGVSGGCSSEGTSHQYKESTSQAQPSSNSSFEDGQADNNIINNNLGNKNASSGNVTNNTTDMTHKLFTNVTSTSLRLCQGESPDSGVTNESGSSKWMKEHSGADPDDDGVIHCKIFFEKEEVGRTLDLSLFGNYEELYDRLASMFTMDKSKLSGRVVYRDLEGSTIYIGGEPYGNFVKSVRRLTILAVPSSSTESRSAQSW
ncbi:hypothetical protein SELMODRAFT_437622 [Selaginella moellendorffii]|uniref:Auxin response factor n=1 Tax=Selaginella moellendorffii TaxID=88036 RepID=D8QNG6_SELML|nr:auxin response factor 16 [Selaginella moellendorffii]XP_024531629.1 auxin response factor 16 [Selaginella moellendorffii]EFJ38760.1 hypothetical protein SELMODRAFT_437622 [Selaginella moellendorffii]|eukprot:XP_024531139.1 auxin response factor 16 [Selaginella moellendorffii]